MQAISFFLVIGALEARSYVEELKSLLIDEPDHPKRQIMEDEIRRSEKVLAMID